MNSKEIRDLTEAYLSVYEDVEEFYEDEELDEEERRIVTKGVSTNAESYDLYDLVLDHLLDEGYANTVENAEVIMANMSEGWMNEIVEAASHTIMSVRRPDPEVKGFSKKVYDRHPNLTRITDTLAALRQSKREKTRRASQERSAAELEKAQKRSIERGSGGYEEAGSMHNPQLWHPSIPNRMARVRRASGR